MATRKRVRKAVEKKEAASMSAPAVGTRDGITVPLSATQAAEVRVYADRTRYSKSEITGMVAEEVAATVSVGELVKARAQEELAALTGMDPLSD